ncbi:cytosolic Fe-S cluster assembly factor NUBP2 homolog isoform X1 [Xenia sp. Carnegie-2017]|uniref:cytosolic Fe-S cluster assembly factor NUBP2 homolog isoform X1 n=1 Tax=Xenia sp. Carnegie-2017 TaxID=2897299 RepID=UPI001F04CD14|nr:cytosolic Fe-S cluster assembly factor NUBP2 homolog isoform X1 [Xenia sp. Carnegie-2017]
MENSTDQSSLSSVKHIFLVLSGKGGVGKSTVASQLACALYSRGKKVGLLDIDLCGPSIPRLMKLEGSNVHKCSDGWVPVYTRPDQRLGVMSIGFLLANRDDPVVWRGPKKNSMIKQFISDVFWGDLDYLVIDTPPGTSDEHITVVESLQPFSPDGAILVTTPQVRQKSIYKIIKVSIVIPHHPSSSLFQAVSIDDVRRELSFCRKTNLSILGIIENMSGFICPHCSECSNVFSSGGGKALARLCNVSFLGNVPLDPKLARCIEESEDFLQAFVESEANKSFNKIVDKLTQKHHYN